MAILWRPPVTPKGRWGNADRQRRYGADIDESNGAVRLEEDSNTESVQRVFPRFRESSDDMLRSTAKTHTAVVYVNCPFSEPRKTLF